MRHHFFRFHALSYKLRIIFSEEVLAALVALLVFVAPVTATRFAARGLFMQSVTPDATTSYTVSLQFMSPASVGSVDMLFCFDPIPDDPCVVPPGLDVSHAVLSSQSGETGFTIDPATHTANHILLTRPPTIPTASAVSSYTFTGIVNPHYTTEAFAIRMKSLSSTDGTGEQIDFGSVMGEVSKAIIIQTQVPPMLLFCAAQEVELGCSSTDNNYYSDMGELSADSTLTAQSQFAVGTNATGGFAVTANGTPLAAGTSVIDGPATPSVSTKGVNQFGINLVANNAPIVGDNPEGTFANAVPSSGYDEPDKYKYVSGDIIAYSPNVSLMKKFTVSYIVNSSKDLRPGVYTTTITYIASGRF